MMKKRILMLFLAFAALLGCCGCALFEKEYTYSVPYVGSLSHDTDNATEVRNYSMLKAAILDMINNHQESAEFRFSNYLGTVSDDLAAVALEVKSDNPLGAYAVETLDYDTSRIVSYYIAEVSITYKRTAEEIQSVRTVNSTEELKNFLHDEVLAQSLPRIAVRTYQTQLDEDSVKKLLEELWFEDPVNIPLPVQDVVAGYPKEGSNRIFEISLEYLLSAPQREAMSAAIRNGIGALLSQPIPQESNAKALALANMLNSSLTESVGAYSSTAYGAIVERCADSRGIALAYRALCRSAGIDCMVVKGSIGAMGTEEHYWNIITLGGDCYHVDVSQFVFDPAYAFLISDDGLWGRYIWNTDEYPACNGVLRYADVVPETVPREPEKTPEEPEEIPNPEETEAPDEIIS